MSPCVASRSKGRVPETLLLATCVTLAPLLQLSALRLLTCGQVSCPPPPPSCSCVRAGALSQAVCKETVGIRICRQDKGQVQGQKKKEREEGRVGAEGSLALMARGRVGEVPCLSPFFMIQEVWATVPSASESDPFTCIPGAQGDREKAWEAR